MVRNFARCIVRRAFFAAPDWPNLPAEVLQLIASGDRAGFVLALALCGELRATETNTALIADFSTAFLTLFAGFAQCGDLDLLDLSFHCASRLLLCPAVPFFQDLAPAIGPIVERSFSVSASRNDPARLRFASAALKFSVAFVSNCGTHLPNLEIPGAYLRVVFDLFRTEIPIKMRCLLCQLLHAVLSLPR
jgi:hypothetical protein